MEGVIDWMLGGDVGVAGRLKEASKYIYVSQKGRVGECSDKRQAVR